MELFVKLSCDKTYANPLSVLMEVVKTEISQFKLVMICSHQLEPSAFQITGSCSDHHCPIYTAEEMLNGSPDFPILNGGFIEQWKMECVPREVTRNHHQDLFQGELEGFELALVIPIWMGGEVERWIVLVDYELVSQGIDERRKAKLDFNKLALLINYALTNILRSEQKRQLDKARLWIDEELQEISRLQMLLLPQDSLTIPGTDLAFTFKAFKDAGGDYLDLFQLPSPDDSPEVTHWGGIIADVTGHGPSAAVEAAMLDAILRTFPGNTESTPADAANYLNENFFTRRDRGKFVTAMLFVYQSDTRMLRYVSAGHPNGYIKRDSEIIVLDQSKGIPIGVLPDYRWEYKEFELRKGDILFIYTDVVLETRNSRGEEFGEVRLMESLLAAPNCPHQLIDHVEQALLEFNEKGELMDDLTLAAIKTL